MSKTLSLLVACIFALSAGLTSCSEDSEPMTQPNSDNLTIDGSCNVYKIKENPGEDWTITSSTPWITPVADKGTASDAVKIYVESNIDAHREGNVCIKYKSGKTRSITVAQSNEQTTPSIQRTYAVGWSFDVRSYMDYRGLRGQVFNTQKIYAYDKDMYKIDRDPSSHIYLYYGESGSELAEDMSAKLELTGKFNSFSMDIQGAFGKSALNDSKRIFAKIRATYPEIDVYLNQYDALDVQANDLFTVDFASARKGVIESKGSDESIRNLIDNYGTHFVIEAYLGGLYDYYFSSVVENAQDLLNVKAALDFGFSEKFNLEGNAKYKDDFEKLSQERIEKFSVKGGDAITLSMAVENGTVNKDVTGAWLESLHIDRKFELIDFKLISLSELFPGEIENKINAYTNRMYYREIAVTRSAK